MCVCERMIALNDDQTICIIERKAGNEAGRVAIKCYRLKTERKEMIK